MISLRLANLSGYSAKSLGCQPAAKDMPTRPLERLSTSDQSSARRIVLCSGETQLPARIWMSLVMVAIAALLTTGLGNKPPKA